jgi:hypothetical protein
LAVALVASALLLLPAMASAVGTGSIKGTVIDASSKVGIEGIEVCAYEAPEYEFAVCEETDSAGEYTLSGLTTGSYRVEFWGRNHGLNYLTQYYNNKTSFSQATAVPVTAPATVSNINAEMHPGGQIKGKVIDAVSKAGIEGVEVCAHGSTAFGGCVETDASGEYTLSGLATGTYEVEFWPASLNYFGQLYNGKSFSENGTPVSVTAGAVTSGIGAELTPGGQIKGKVTDALSHGALAGIEVCALEAATDEYVNCTETDSSGEYALSRLSSGAYKVEFWAAGSLNYVTQYYNDKASLVAADPVSVTAGATTSGVDAAMRVGGRVSGSVTSVTTGVPLAGILVCAYEISSGHYVRCVQSNGNGKYTIGGLAGGTYKVAFSLEFEEGFEDDGYQLQFYNDKPTLGQADAVAVTPPGTVSSVDAHLLKTGATVPIAPIVAPVVPGPVVKRALPSPHCRKGFRKTTRHGKKVCAKIKKHHAKHRR